MSDNGLEKTILSNLSLSFSWNLNKFPDETFFICKMAIRIGIFIIKKKIWICSSFPPSLVFFSFFLNVFVCNVYCGILLVRTGRFILVKILISNGLESDDTIFQNFMRVILGKE